MTETTGKGFAETIEQILNEAYNTGIDHAIKALGDISVHPVNENSASFFWGIDKDDAVSALESLKKEIK